MRQSVDPTANGHSRRLCRRHFLALAGAGAAGLVAGCDTATDRVSGKRKPNVIVILADDLGYGDVCCYGCHGAMTPNIDSIAKNGVLFTDGYVTGAVCSPSRAGLLTGRYQQRFGHEFNPQPSERAAKEGLGLPLSEITMADQMKKAGYATGMIGKSHLGALPRFNPLHRGFDEFFGFYAGASLYLEPMLGPGIHYVEAYPPGTKPTRNEFDAIRRGMEIVDEPEYLTDAFTREAVDFIERHKDEPFFLYVPYNAPHTPLQVTDEYYQRFAHIKSERHRIYAAMVSCMDDGIGRIVDTLKKLHIYEDTMVFFLSDNGCAMYTCACYNEPLKAGKSFPFEGGIRVPFVVQWPGRIKPGQVCAHPVSAIDIFPTAVELAGGEMPNDRPIDGASLVPILTGASDASPHESLFWRAGPNYALRKGDWKLISLNDKRTLLYDLSNDIQENFDLSEEKPEIVAELMKDYKAWESEMVEPLWPTGFKLTVNMEWHGLDMVAYEFHI